MWVVGVIPSWLILCSFLMVKIENYIVIKFISRITTDNFYFLYLSIFPHEKVDQLINQIGIPDNVLIIGKLNKKR
jgi:hypothetical protein